MVVLWFKNFKISQNLLAIRNDELTGASVSIESIGYGVIHTGFGIGFADTGNEVADNGTPLRKYGFMYSNTAIGDAIVYLIARANREQENIAIVSGVYILF